MAKVDVGDEAPEFELPGTGGRTYRLADYRGGNLVLAFYPGDATRVCTAQFCSYRDNADRLDQLDAEVLGISPQSVDSHERWTQEQELNVPLLADEDLAVSKLYGVVGWASPLAKVVGLDDDVGRLLRDALDLHRRRRGDRPPPATSRTGASYQSVGDIERALAARRLMPAEPVQFDGRRRTDDPRRAHGGGPGDRPLPRDHRDPALRGPRLAGAGARRPYVVTYDARGHGESDPAPAGPGLWIPGAGRRPRVGGRGDGGRGPLRPRRPLDGRPHRGRLRAPPSRAPRGPGRDRARCTRARCPRRRLEYWDGLADALRDGGVEGFVDCVGEHQGPTPTGARRSPGSAANGSAPPPPGGARRAIREVPARGRSSRSRDLDALEVPALVVASHDGADPGHPRAVAEAYAEHLPRARLISEEEGSRRWPGRAGGSRARSPISALGSSLWAVLPAWTRARRSTTRRWSAAPPRTGPTGSRSAGSSQILDN